MFPQAVSRRLALSRNHLFAGHRLLLRIPTGSIPGSSTDESGPGRKAWPFSCHDIRSAFGRKELLRPTEFGSYAGECGPTVIAVLAASPDGASINTAAKGSGINYRTAQRIVAAAAAQRQRQLVVVG